MGQDEIAYRDIYIPELILYSFPWIGQFEMCSFTTQVVIETSNNLHFCLIACIFFLYLGKIDDPLCNMLAKSKRRFGGFVFSRSMMRKYIFFFFGLRLIEIKIEREIDTNLN